MQRHRWIQDLGTGVAQERLTKRRTWIAERKRTFTQCPQGRLDEGEIEEKEVALVQRHRAQEDRRTKEKLQGCEQQQKKCGFGLRTSHKK